MNKREIDFLKANWEKMQKKLEYSLSVEELDISNGCYASFGTVGVSVFKYRNKRWFRKIINHWKALSFAKFMEAFNKAEWEKV